VRALRSCLTANFRLWVWRGAGRQRVLRRAGQLALAAAMAFPVALAAQHTAPAAGDRAQTQVLANHHPLWARSANDRGAIAPDRLLPQMTMVLARTAEQEAAFDQLLVAQQDPSSPSYHHWLTPAEVGERFGPSPDQVAAVTGWLEAAGLHVNWVAPSRTFIGFTGSAAAVGRAFQTEMHAYAVRGDERYAVASDPEIPAALAEVVKAVRGLFTVNERPQHSFRAIDLASPQATDSAGDHFLAPWDFDTIYNVPGGPGGGGETIGIVGEARVNTADITNFNRITEATVPTPTEVVPAAFGGVDPGPPLTAMPAGNTSHADQGEATLDVLRAGSVAGGAKLLLVVATAASGGVGDDAEYLVQTTPVPAQIMTISFGACESESGVSGVDFWDGLFQQAASEGISVFVSSGDSGASGCDTSFGGPPSNPEPNSPNVICSSTYATCVGGTEFNDAADPAEYWSTSNNAELGSALGHIPEGAWNEPLDAKGEPEVAATGGGVSKFIATPSWQTGTGVPSARAGRYTPDVSFSASGHDGYFACFAAGGGSCVDGTNGSFSFVAFSGTSAAAPSMAGVAALLDDYLGTSEGNLNPGIYTTAAVFPFAFHDVTVSSSGVTGCAVNTPSMCNNSIPGPTDLTGGQGGYVVGTGYDEATGLGSLEVANFVYNYTTSTAKIAPTVTLIQNSDNITSIQSMNVQIIVAGGSNNPTATGTVTLTSGSYSSSATTLSQGSATITIPGGALAIGTDTLTAEYAPDSNSATTYNSASGTGSVTVTAATPVVPGVTMALASTNITAAQSLTVQIAVRGGTADPTPTGSVTLTSGTYASSSTALSSDGGTSITIPAGALAVGTDTLTANYTPDSDSSAIYTSAPGTASVTVTQAPPPSFAVGSASVTLYPGATTGNAANISVTPAGGFTGSVTLTAAITSSPAGAQDLPTLSFGATTPLSITGTTAGTAALTITTTAATSAAVHIPVRSGSPWIAAAGTALAGLLLLWGPRRRRSWQAILGMLALLAVFTGSLLACSTVQGGGGNGNPGTTAGTYTITVSATSGSETQTTPVGLTVE